jgi:hypothetical protein
VTNEKEIRNFMESLKHVSQEKKEEFIENCRLLYINGLGKIVENIINNIRKSGDFITEHNFAVALVKNNPDITISYEPPTSSCHGIHKRPIDLYVKKNGTSFWFQIKSLGLTERENRKNKLLKKIRAELNAIQGNYFASVYLDDSFSEDDINELIQGIDINAKNNKLTERKITKKGKIIAKYQLIKPNGKVFEHVTIGFSGDLEAVWITGIEESQILNSINKASTAFEWDPSIDEINLIVQLADMHDDIDIAAVVFGREFLTVKYNEPKDFSWGRKNGGFFYTEEGKKVSGLLVIRSGLDRLSWSFSTTLFVNESYPYVVDCISKLIHIDKVYNYSDFIEK